MRPLATAASTSAPVRQTATSSGLPSAIVQPDGTVSQHSEIFAPAHLVAELPLRESITPAVRMGGAVELLLVAVGALLGLGALSIALRRYAAKNRSTDDVKELS